MPKVESNDEDGAFYAQVTLEKLPQPLQPMTIEDWPDYAYRGFMLDVVRDFRTVDEVLEIIDLMASWKLNTLHFHIADDESWCLEIKDFPELTDFGAHHALPDWNLQETSALKPSANGKIGNTSFYTAEEYQRILRYAWDRRVRVIPEFDTPGHSRASIKAMQAYEKHTGDSSFRLQDPADTSRYWSAQDFTDNVLSVYLPSVYKFYGAVFDEVIRLHKEAGVPLPAIHIGGDEVPEGAWSGHDRHEMKETFINGMLDLAEARDIRLAGWEDIAKGLEPETQERLKNSLYSINVWNTDGIEGFPVVLSPAAYTYLDLAYSDAPEEIGLSWAGYVDERKTFSLNPNDYKGDIIGVQAQLWSSQLRSFDDATFGLHNFGVLMMRLTRCFPRFLGWPKGDGMAGISKLLIPHSTASIASSLAERCRFGNKRVMPLRKDSIYGIGKKNRKNSEKGWIFADNGIIHFWISFTRCAYFSSCPSMKSSLYLRSQKPLPRAT